MTSRCRCSAIALTGWLLTVPSTVFGGGADAPLVDAVRHLDRSSIDTLLSRGVDVNASESDGTTALHWAAHHGDLKTVSLLVEAGADVASVNRYGVTPIWLASEGGYAGLVELLLRAGVDPNAGRGDSGETVLMIAARAGQVDVLQRLISYDADVNRRDRVRDQTALMWAAAEGHRAAARLLAEAGAALDVQSSTGITPLMFAIRSGDIDTVREMLDQGADLQATGPDGTTMLVLAILNAHWELAEFLLEQGADPNGDDPVHGRPLQALTIVRRAENRGLSPVLPRAPSGKIDSIKLAEALLANGADINDAVDWKNPRHVPPHMALSYSLGVSFTGATPFFIAAKNCDVEFLRFLVANGADPLIGTQEGVTPLLAAAGVGYTIGESPGTPDEALEAVQMLAELGDDLEALMGGEVEMEDGSPGAQFGRGWEGGSALQGAVIRGAEGLVRWLIDQGVPLDHQMASGETALDLAEGSGLGITYHVQPELAAVIREAMVTQGLEVPDRHDRTHPGSGAGS